MPSPTDIAEVSKRKGAGFTLIELLVVISVVGLLVAMLVPSLFAAKRMALRVQCADHLHLIGGAYAARKIDEQRGIVEPLTALGWAGKLMPYLGSDGGEITKCPAQTREGGDASMAGIVVYVWGAFDMYLRPGPWVLKTDETGSGYKLRFEDWRSGSSDRDYNDVVLGIDYMATGNVRITVLHSDSANHFDLLGPQREVLLYDIETQIGRSITTMGVSYGMNNMVHAFRPGGPWVLAMDYAKEVADCAGPDAGDDWNEWADPATGKLRFARHRNRCNVLFADTAVRSVTPDEIDPDDPAIAQRYWAP